MANCQRHIMLFLTTRQLAAQHSIALASASRVYVELENIGLDDHPHLPLG